MQSYKMRSYKLVEPPQGEGWDEVQEYLVGLFSDAWAGNYIKNHFARCVDDARRIHDLLGAGGSVLNIGGAPYIFEVAAQRLGLSTVSVDLDPQRHKDVVNSLSGEVIAGNIEDEKFRRGLSLHGYGAICLCEVFEHMRHDILSLLGDLNTAMEPGTILYLTTPNYYFAPRFLSMLLQRRSGPSPVKEWSKLIDIGHMGHVREYSLVEIEELIHHAGFKIDEIHVRNRYGSRSRPLLKRLASWALHRMPLFGQEFVVIARAAGGDAPSSSSPSTKS